MTDFTLSPEEARVLGCLIEKQITTPEYYPLTLHALVAACNQKNNRDPVTAFDDRTVVRALDALRERKLAAMVSEAGARVPKYRHAAAEGLALDPPDLALACELLLRGPQTPGELRNRAGRMHSFASLAEVQERLEALASRADGPHVVKLPRQPGTKESRYMHLYGGPPPVAAPDGTPDAPPEPARLEISSENERLALLEADVAALRSEVSQLGEELRQFRRQFE